MRCPQKHSLSGKSLVVPQGFTEWPYTEDPETTLLLISCWLGYEVSIWEAEWVRCCEDSLSSKLLECIEVCIALSKFLRASEEIPSSGLDIILIFCAIFPSTLIVFLTFSKFLDIYSISFDKESFTIRNVYRVFEDEQAVKVPFKCCWSYLFAYDKSFKSLTKALEMIYDVALS